MRVPFVLAIAILVLLYAGCEALYIQRHRSVVDPHECFGASRYDAMRDGRACPEFEGR